MRRLRKRFPDELVVVGVHAGKFTAEHDLENVREAVLRHGIEHPVVNDPDYAIWRDYEVQAGPTLVLIGPDGDVLAAQAGEISAAELEPVLETMIAQYDLKGLLDRTPIDLEAAGPDESSSVLLYPSKVLAAPGGRVFVADTGHHRVLELALGDGCRQARIVRAFGTGEEGLADGAPGAAAFREPRGLSLRDQTLYVADTGNHAIRAIDLAGGVVRTVAGTGRKASGAGAPEGDPRRTSLRSPWAVLAEDEFVFIAMAGTHQIWVLIGEKDVGPFAGSGREALVDGPRAQAAFNQPSDLAFGMGHLFVADAEASAIRAVSLDQDPRVLTLVGQGLFEFGDEDGAGADVRLQHPTGVAFADGVVYVADTYNHKVKKLDPTTGRVDTLFGSGEPGPTDGSFEEAELYEPEGLSILGSRLFVADTNDHVLRVADLEAGLVHTLEIE